MRSDPRKLPLLILIGVLMAVAWSVAMAHDPRAELKPFVPEGAILFEFDQTDELEGTIVDEIEFTPNRCNMILHNRTNQRRAVNVTVAALNRDGVVIWAESEQWVIDKLDPGEKYLASLPFYTELPASLAFSRYAEGFDQTPHSYLIVDHLAPEAEPRRRR